MVDLKHKHTLISIVGPTAVGKTSLAIACAQKYSTEIISLDARQFYKQLDIGTAKPTSEELKLAKHHFINILSPTESCTPAWFEERALGCLDRLFKLFPVVITTGGSTLYAHALWYGMDEMPTVSSAIREELQIMYQEKGLDHLLEELQKVDPKTYANIDRQNHTRVLRALEVYRASGKPISFFRRQQNLQSQRPFNLINIGLHLERSILYDRINDRVDKMVADGLFEEVKSLLANDIPENAQSLRSIGYREIIDYYNGSIDKETAIRLIKRNSRRYAKRQLTYFRRYKDIRWFDAQNKNEILQYLSQLIDD